MQNVPEETDHKLHGKHAHCHETQPCVQAVEVRFRRLREIVRIEYGQESQSDAWNGACMEQHVNQFHIDVFQAAAQAIQKNCWRGIEED